MDKAWWQTVLIVFASIEHMERMEMLLADRDRVLDAIECPSHGRCVPYALEQIESMKRHVNA